MMRVVTWKYQCGKIDWRSLLSGGNVDSRGISKKAWKGPEWLLKDKAKEMQKYQMTVISYL